MLYYLQITIHEENDTISTINKLFIVKKGTFELVQPNKLNRTSLRRLGQSIYTYK